MTSHPLMPKATAVWLVDNTSLSFEQIAEFCGLHPLEVKGIADGDVALGVRGKSPVTAGELSRDEISKAEADPDHRLKLLTSKVKVPEIKAKKRPRYTPVSRRQDRPNAVLWLLRNHGELRDSQIMRLVGTTKPTITQIRDRSHWNSPNLLAQDPVMLGLCAQAELDVEVEKAAKRVAKERQAAGLPPLEMSETLLPTAQTTGYELPIYSAPTTHERAPTAENIFGAATSVTSREADDEADEAARVFAKLKDMKPGAPQPAGDAPADAPAPDDREETVAAADVSKSEAPESDGGSDCDTGGVTGAASRKDDAALVHLAAVKKFAPKFNEAAARGIIRHLGIALRSRDASLVACSSKEELERVRESWLKKKLALDAPDEALDAMIEAVCKVMRIDQQKNRVAFYYLLADKAGKLAQLA